ncbi:MAG: NAD-dependent DNA ligase LigA, partial [Candidatus Riflebacteria bacterium]|nr:NAD-dependent DNA ligase LigA [Candidatus Riflebacteria bacterium]
VMVYGIAQAKELGFKKHSEALDFLKQQGFKLNQEIQICNSVEEVKTFIDRIDVERQNFQFDIDGVVLKIDDLDKQEELGTTAKAPRWVIAYKFPQPRAKSKLLNVEWRVGRSRITPVAWIEPVELCGTTVSRASLHNIDQIREKDIRLGDYLLVEKAAYIIPYVVGSVKEERTGEEKEIEIPEFCPACGGKTTTAKDDEDGSTIVRCDNENCFGVKARKTTHFITQLEIDNFGPQLVDRLLENKIINQPEDILKLTETQLASVDRMGIKSASKIVANIKKASEKPLFRLISAFGISNVGPVVSENIAKTVHQSFEEFLEVSLEKLVNIEGVQEKIASNIIDFIKNPSNQSFISTIKEWWHGPSQDQLDSQKTTNKLEGKSFVVTGEAVVPRRKLEELIKSSGGQTKSSVSAKTDYLVIGSLENESFVSTKKNKAVELGKPIINEFELCKMVDINIDDIK